MKLHSEWVCLAKISKKINIPSRLSSSKFDVSRADCSDWRRFTILYILLADFDFVTRWTEIKIHPTLGPNSHALTLSLNDSKPQVHPVTSRTSNNVSVRSCNMDKTQEFKALRM